jgi:hypothetical protein
MALVLVPNLPGGGSGITQLTGDVNAGPGSGSVVATLANIPTGTTGGGYVEFTAIAAPAAPAAGKVRAWFDTTTLTWQSLNSFLNKAGMAYTKGAAASNWLNSFDPTTGTFTATQPAYSDISGSIPNDTPAAGSVKFTEIAAPVAPAAGLLEVWADSTTGALRGRSSGNLCTMAFQFAAVANQFINNFDGTSGLFSAAQPAFSNLSGAVGASQAPGRLLRAPQVLTSGTTISHPATTATVVVIGVGGGGAGGGAGAAAGAIGGNGGSGTYGMKTFTSAASSSTFAIGGAGAGSSGAGGGSGGSSTFTNNAVTMTLPGGSGGAATAGAASVATAAGGAGGGAATNADFSINGQTGGAAVRPAAATTPNFHTNSGGSNPLGFGGASHAVAATTVVAGSVGVGFGAGGSGVLNGTTASASAGAAGTAGAFIVWEYSS